MLGMFVFFFLFFFCERKGSCVMRRLRSEREVRNDEDEL